MFEENVLLAPFTKMKVGGYARYFVKARSREEMQKAFAFCREKEMAYFVLGKGSNVIFDDRGFRGLVILNKMDDFFLDVEGMCVVGSGYSFSRLGMRTAKEGWSGLEFAVGIPGSVGGAVFMNAGADGGETFDRLSSVEYLGECGEILTLKKEDLFFSYRNTSFQEMRGVVLNASFVLERCDAARERQMSILQRRKDTQPYGEASAGCVFRNAESVSAGKLIDGCGLKNTKIGSACVSEVHANFIVNLGGATSKDLLSLISHVKKRVYEKTGVVLEQEVCFVPYE